MKKRHQVYRWLRYIQHLLLPSSCSLCGGPGHQGRDLCEGCAEELPWLRRACIRCGSPLAIDQSLCGGCQQKPPPFDGLTATFHYEPPVDRLILDLKFHRRLTAARLLGELMADAPPSFQGRHPTVLLPVPLHPRRIRQRGYNQATELARPIAARLGLPIGFGLVHRQRATPEQSRLSGRERARNVKGAFAVTGDVRGRDIAVIDDVVTTGSTVAELARVLKSAGARSVHIWACARAGEP